MISEEEDLASVPGKRARFDVKQSFIKVGKGTDKASDIDIRRMDSALPL